MKKKGLQESYNFREKKKIQNSEKPHIKHWLHDNVNLMDKDFSIPNYSQINLNKEKVVAIACLSKKSVRAESTLPLS